MGPFILPMFHNDRKPSRRFDDYSFLPLMQPIKTIQNQIKSVKITKIHKILNTESFKRKSDYYKA